MVVSGGAGFEGKAKKLLMAAAGVKQIVSDF